jgi:hypothetical protein
MKYMMSKRALGKATVIQGAVEGHYTVKQAAAKLRISERRCSNNVYLHESVKFPPHLRPETPASLSGEYRFSRL